MKNRPKATWFYVMRAAPLVAFALLGCTTTQQAADALGQKYLGQNIDAFVVAYGAPYAKHILNSGDAMYTWNSGVHSYGMPTTTTVQGTRTPMGFSGTATTSGGGSINVFCEVRIVTAPDGTVKSILPVGDTIGRWTTSRCGEIFKSGMQ